jgi:hypothetical protein
MTPFLALNKNLKKTRAKTTSITSTLACALPVSIPWNRVNDDIVGLSTFTSTMSIAKSKETRLLFVINVVFPMSLLATSLALLVRIRMAIPMRPRCWDRALQLLLLNEESLVSASHQLMLNSQ